MRKITRAGNYLSNYWGLVVFILSVLWIERSRENERESERMEKKKVRDTYPWIKAQRNFD